ncbi:MAG: tetratricopeptide repeat protein [Desulfobacteraceae bacterium]|nr:tetratricopeptide repeat protein [Desulfobacteraceae bacterium]
MGEIEVASKKLANYQKDVFGVELGAILKNFTKIIAIISKLNLNKKQITQKELKFKHRRAHAFFMQKKYDKSQIFYFHLCIAQPFDGRFWFGLGETLRKNGDFEKAIQAFEFSCLLLPGDPKPAYFAGLCWLKLNNAAKAKFFFKIATYFPVNSKINKVFINRAQTLVDNIEKKEKTDE